MLVVSVKQDHSDYQLTSRRLFRTTPSATQLGSFVPTQGHADYCHRILRGLRQKRERHDYTRSLDKKIPQSCSRIFV
jgi:hypothetical protein